jgi:DNA-binding MarR family transcriptional regulator
VALVDATPAVSETVVVAQFSRAANVYDDPEGLATLAARLETAARGLLALSTQAVSNLPGGLSLTQLRALAAAEQVGSCTLGTLAEALVISTSSASRLVDRLVAAGVLDRRLSETNRREVTVEVTTAGRRLLRAYESARRAVFAELLRKLSAGETRALLRGLEAVRRHVKLS